MEGKLRIFELRSGKSDKQWIAAETVIKALQMYEDITGVQLRDYQDSDNIVELPKKKWEKYTVENYGGKITFKEWMEQNNKPDIIAVTYE